MPDDGKVIELTATAGQRGEALDGGQLRRGQAIGRYMVVEMLGQGGMGIVYAAYDPDLDRKVALKLLRQRGSSATRSSRSRLLREARAMAKLHHPNVVTVYEVGTSGDDDFVAMQYVEGSNLGEWLSEGGRRASWRQIVGAFQQAGRGLAAAHRAGLIHRDFKPTNVLVDQEGRVRVTDFGIAQLLGDEAEAPEADGANVPIDGLTRTGATMGTPAYMAPEQYLGKETNERTDQFSFCVALYEALYGERPFAGADYDALRGSVTAGTVRDEPHGADVPGWIRKILLRGLSVDPDARYPDMAALLADLSRDPAESRRRLMMVGGFLIVVAVIVAIVLQDREGKAPSVCTDARSELAGVWDDDVKAQVHTAFDRARIPDETSERAYQGFSSVLDKYADGWVGMRTEACRARFVDKTESQDDHLLRMSCLQSKRGELGALAQVFTRADEAAVEQASQAARGLSSLDECANLESLRSGLEPPRPEQRQAVAEVRAMLSEVKALDEAAQKGRALERVQEALRTAREIGYKPMLAEALYWSGRVSAGLGHSTEARASYDDAIIVAEEAGHLQIRAQAMIGMTEVTVAFTSRVEEARLWGRRAAAAIKSLGGDALMTGRLNELLASTLIQENKLDEALELLDETRALYRGLDEPEKMARVYNNRGAVLMRKHDYSDALEEYRDALVLYENNFGRDHPRTVLAMESFASALRAIGNYDTSREYFTRAEKFWATDRGREYIADRLPADAVVGARTIRGRVTDAMGAPVAKAEVVIGQRIMGDGKYLWASDGGQQNARRGMKRVLTDDKGLFEIAAVGDEEIVIAAEHWSEGRSAMKPIADGDTDKAVGLMLRPVGSISGRVTIDGAPTPGVIVVLKDKSVVGQRGSGTAVVASSDGSYVFEAVGHGDWDLMVVRGHGPTDQDLLYSETVTVESGKAAEANVQIRRGQIRLDVSVRGESGARIESAQVLIAPGIVKASTVAELSPKVLALMTSGRVKSLFVAHGRTEPFEGVKPGLYSLCTVPLAGDHRDPEFMGKLAPHALELDTYCEPLDILPKPKRQSYTAVVPPMAPLAE